MSPFIPSQVAKPRPKNLPTAIGAIRGMRARCRFPSESFLFTRTNPWRCRQRGLSEGTPGGQERYLVQTSQMGYPSVESRPSLMSGLGQVYRQRNRDSGVKSFCLGSHQTGTLHTLPLASGLDLSPPKWTQEAMVLVAWILGPSGPTSSLQS